MPPDVRPLRLRPADGKAVPGTAAATEWNPEATAIQNARRVLPALVRSFFAAGRAACLPGVAFEAMHEFRLEAKRFRYTLELMLPLYGTGLAQRLESLQEVQTLLGDLNDCVATHELLSEPAYQDQAETPRMLSFLETRALRQATRFRTHWQTTFDAPGELERWVQYLARPSRVRRRRTAAGAS